MSSDERDRDAELLGELRSLLGRVDAAPGEVDEFARAALGWRRLDAELAELLEDSALESGRVAATRAGESEGRWLTFQAAGLAIDLEVRTDDRQWTLLGQLAPATAATVEVQAADGSLAARTEADALGRFRLELSAGGRIRLRLLREGEPAVETSWLPL
jgi:hypothetical protein